MDPSGSLTAIYRSFYLDLTFKEISFLVLWVSLLGVSSGSDHTNVMQKFPPPKVVAFTSLNAFSRTGLKFNWGETQEIELNELRH